MSDPTTPPKADTTAPPKSRDHQIERSGEHYHCTVCDWLWRSKPDTVCPGVPRYNWGDVPAHLHSKTGLNKRKLQPGGPPRGCVMNVYDGSYWWLYDERETLPYTPPKREQKRRRPNQSELRLLFMCYMQPGELYHRQKDLAENCRKEGWLVYGSGDTEHLRAWWQITKRGIAELEHWMPLLKDRMGYLKHLEQRDRRRSELLQELYHVITYQQDPTRYCQYGDSPPDVDHAMQRLRRELGYADHPSARDQNEVIVWARELLARGNWCVLDTETTGLYEHDEIVQIAVIAPDSTVLLDTLLRPTKAISPGATEVHGLTNELLADAPAFPEIAEQLKAILTGRLIVSFNAEFDRRMLIQTRERYQVPELGVPADRWECAMLRYSAYCGEWHDYYRDYRYQSLPGGDHTALGDARATLALIQKIAATKMAYVEPVL